MRALAQSYKLKMNPRAIRLSVKLGSVATLRQVRRIWIIGIEIYPGYPVGSNLGREMIREGAVKNRRGKLSRRV